MHYEGKAPGIIDSPVYSHHVVVFVVVGFANFFWNKKIKHNAVNLFKMFL